MIATSIRMTDAELIRLQRSGERHVGFSLTKACPLSCAHCSAATVPASMRRAVSMPAALVRRCCAEMPALAARGVRAISLTGGEPVLCLDDVAALSRAAREAGIRTTLVTGLYWAAGPASRRRVIAALPDVDRWNISWDRFHAAEVRLTDVAHAARAIRDTGAAVTIRVAVDDPATPEDEAMYDRLVDAIPDVEIVVQSVRPVGRAGGAVPPADPPPRAAGDVSAPSWPCLSTGPLVMPDGSARPCCSSMMDEPDHPFAARSAAHGLAALHRDWTDDPLLLLLRGIGFAPIIRLIGEIAPDHALAKGSTAHPCDVCATVFGDRELAGRIKAACTREPLAGLARHAAAAVLDHGAVRETVDA